MSKVDLMDKMEKIRYKHVGSGPNGQKWTKMVQSCPKWINYTKRIKTFPKWTKWTKMIQNGPNMSKVHQMIQNGPKCHSRDISSSTFYLQPIMKIFPTIFRDGGYKAEFRKKFDPWLWKRQMLAMRKLEQDESRSRISGGTDNCVGAYFRNIIICI